MQVLDVLETMGIGKNTTSKSVEAGGSTEGKYEDETKHPTFFTLPVSNTSRYYMVKLSVNGLIILCSNRVVQCLFPQVATETSFATCCCLYISMANYGVCGYFIRVL